MPVRREISAFASQFFEPLEPRALLTANFDGVPLISELPDRNLGPVQSIAMGDYDGDGDTDMAVSFHDPAAGPTGHGIAFYRGNDNGTFAAPVWSSLSVRAGELGAVRFHHILPPTGGGSELIALGGFVTDASRTLFARIAVRVLRLNPFTGVFGVAALLKVDPLPAHFGETLFNARPGAPLIEDFTGDSRDDIAFAISTTQRGVAVVRRPSVNTLSLHTRIDTEVIAGDPDHNSIDPQPVTLADFDNDGRKDIVLRTVPGFSVIRNRGGTLGLAAAPRSLGLASNLDWQFADVNGDGNADAISTFTPNQIQSSIIDQVSFLRIRLGTGSVLGTPKFAALQRAATFIDGPALPFGQLGLNSAFTDRRTLIITPDLTGDTLSDFFFLRDYMATDNGLMKSYERASVVIGPAPAGTAPLEWLAPDISITPVSTQDTLPLETVIGRGVPIFADLNHDGRADLVQFVNGRIETRLNILI